jgi:hypothetical protein
MPPIWEEEFSLHERLADVPDSSCGSQPLATKS